MGTLPLSVRRIGRLLGDQVNWLVSRSLVCGERICCYQDREMFINEYYTFQRKYATEHLSTAVNLQVRMSTELLGTLLEDFCGFPQYLE